MPKAAGRHGTRYRYMQGCRCVECRAACATSAAGIRALGTAPNHGTVSGYSTYGCRCDDCKQARSDYMKQRRRNSAHGNA
jgi:hypothetical protein